MVRVAALFGGLTAGLFALLAPTALGIDLLTPFRELWGPSLEQHMLGYIVWHVPIAAALLGGLLALVAPGVGALLLGAAGLAWLGLGWADSSFLRPELLVPGVLSCSGALIAVVAMGVDWRNGRSARRRHPKRPFRPDRDVLPESPERLKRPVRPQPEVKQVTSRADGTAREEARARAEAAAREQARARAEAGAREESRARAEAFFTEFSRLVDQDLLAAPSGTRANASPSGLDLTGEVGSDRYLAGPAALVKGAPNAVALRTEGSIDIAVVGAHDSGLPLNPELVGLGGKFIRAASTTPHYALYALPNTTPPKLALLRNGSTAVGVGVWSLDAAGFGEFVSRIPSPLCVGTLSLDDGTSVKGLLVEASAVQGAEDITHFGRWRVPGAVTHGNALEDGLEPKTIRRIRST